ncbi:MAG: hypothetical protein HY438_01455 [DPANN group archaeon]|nr:hypothetical protein [DPANN group archaeon]
MAAKNKIAKQVPKLANELSSVTKEINILDVIKQAGVQIKYEEMGSWLATHNTPLFFAHERGFSVVDKSFIEKRPWLKDALKKMVDDIESEKKKISEPAVGKIIDREKVGYIG